MKTKTTTTQPQIDERAEQGYLGIRVQTPMRGMSKVIGKTFEALQRWMQRSGVEPSGPPFLRYHVIDMAGEMDIEMCEPVSADVAAALEPGGRVQAGVLPAGRYASLVYNGSGYTGNKVLVEWARDNGIAWDRWEDAKGDAFRSRYERYLTDPAVEPRKTKWQVEVAIKLRD